MKRKKGSTFIETIVGIMIITIIFLVSTMIICENISCSRIRDNIEEGNRIAFCVMQEIKYNITLEEINNRSENGNWGYKRSDNFLEELTNKSLLDLENGDDIIISVFKELDLDKLDIIVDIYNDNGEIVCKKEFIKYKWMDYL